ncbi:hypothetical protein [Kineococcus aurantiacus]|uniref:Integral membrane protein n=1 Tax=Kineococcus aurantiacus TaxID=37633 RepID=A0A7Y9DN26_9ACTN|nr:hypothetical protein [Kineococcus aurantiacus]NYD23548.1 hypothetical protein [Kineococcus aurantiacus]
MPSPSSKAPTDQPRPPLLTAIAALVALEVLLLLAGAAYLVHGLVVDGSSAPLAVVSVVVCALLFGAGLGFCAWGLLRRATWARSPLVVWQLLQVAAGLPAFSGGTPWLGVLLVLPAVAVGVGLFTPSVSAQVGR